MKRNTMHEVKPTEDQEKPLVLNCFIIGCSLLWCILVVVFVVYSLKSIFS